jgi:hypothetical protein
MTCPETGATAAEYMVFDGSTYLATVTVNQSGGVQAQAMAAQASPADETSGSLLSQSLGLFLTSTGTLNVEALSTAAGVLVQRLLTAGMEEKRSPRETEMEWDKNP